MFRPCPLFPVAMRRPLLQRVSFRRVQKLYFVQATNQLSASGSSTAGQYLEAGFKSAYALPKKAVPGLSTNVDIRLSLIPVAAPSTTTTQGTTTTTTIPTTTTTTTTGTASININRLSSQQSVRLVASLFAPWKTTHWNNRSDFFTVAPLSRGGFGTLINPSVSSGTSSSSTPLLASQPLPSIRPIIFLPREPDSLGRDIPPRRMKVRRHSVNF